MRKKRNKKIVFKTKWFYVEQEYYRPPHAMKGGPFYRVVTPDGAIVLAMTKENKIILIKQFRPALNAYTLELPSGYVERGESPKKGLARELYEETGYRCKKLEKLGMGMIMPSRIFHRAHIFLGKGAVRDPSFKPQEHIKVVTVSVKQFKAMVQRGTFYQSVALAVFLLVTLRHPENSTFD